MKIAVLGANGKSGSSAVNEALLRIKNGDKNIQEIVAFVRNDSSNIPRGVKVIKKDIFELQSSDLSNFDVIIDAFAEWQNLALHKKHIEHLHKILKNSSTRLIVVGGAGSLFVDKSHKVRLMDTPDFPKEYLGVAGATAEVLDFLRGTQDLNYTYVSPPADFEFEIPRSGEYILGGEEFFTNSKGESKIGYKDYAIALLDLAINATHNKERVSVNGK